MIQEPIEHFILNAVDLTIKSSSYKGNKETINLPSFLDVESETLTLASDKPLDSQKGILSISFSGKLNDQMK